jgi:hypothetical protein
MLLFVYGRSAVLPVASLSRKAAKTQRKYFCCLRQRHLTFGCHLPTLPASLPACGSVIACLQAAKR